MPKTYHLSQFEGPLDLLLSLIGKAKIDIKDIFVSEVTEQYIKSVEEAEFLDMDEASEFIEMAATLLYIKTRALLPSKEEETQDEEDIEQALIRQLEEYQALKKMAEEMQGFEKAALEIFSKLPEEYPLPPQSFEIVGLTLPKLSLALRELLNRIKDKEEIAPSVRRIVKEEYTVPRCMTSILKRVKKGNVSFMELLGAMPSREAVVTHFLALLELLKLGKIDCYQEEMQGDIILSYVENEGGLLED